MEVLIKQRLDLPDKSWLLVVSTRQHEYVDKQPEGWAASIEEAAEKWLPMIRACAKHLRKHSS
jgi:hypothetical protein